MKFRTGSYQTRASSFENRTWKLEIRNWFTEARIINQENRSWDSKTWDSNTSITQATSQWKRNSEEACWWVES